MIYACKNKAMMTLIIFLIVGSGIGYLVLQNNDQVNLTVASYSLQNVPVYLVILGSMLLGVLLAYLLNLFHAISTAFSIHKKDNKIRKSENDATLLMKKIHQLELANESLKRDQPEAVSDDKSL